MSTLNSWVPARSASRTPCRPWNDMPVSWMRSTAPIVVFAGLSRDHRRASPPPLPGGLGGPRMLWGTNTLTGVIDARAAVRAASEGDLEAINEIYNHYVLESHYTFDDEPLSIDAR